MTQTDPRAVRSRQAMIDAAVRLLHRGGVDEVTHQTVAAEAGVGRATVYRHWPRLTDLLLDALADDAPVVVFAEGDLRGRLVDEFVRHLPEINSGITGALIGVLVGRGDYDAEVHALRTRIFGRLVDAIGAAIATAADEGQLAAGAPARELATMLLGALLLDRTLLGSQVTADQVERVVDAALRGWLKGPPARVSGNRSRLHDEG